MKKKEEPGCSFVLNALFTVTVVTVTAVLYMNTQVMYSNHQVQCVQDDGAVRVISELVVPDEPEDLRRNSTTKVGESSAFGFLVAVVELQSSGFYSVTLVDQITGDEYNFEDVPRCESVEK